MQNLYRSIIRKIEKRFNVDAHHFIGNGSWVGINQVVGIVGSLVVTILFARFLSEEQFGMYRYLVVLASILAVFSLNSIGQSIFQATAKGKVGFFYTAMRLSLISGIGSLALGAGAALYYFLNGNMLLAGGCVLIALMQPFIASYFNIFSYLSGLKKFRESSIFQSFRVLTISTASIVTIYITQSVFILFLVYQLAQLITAYAGYRYFRPQENLEKLSREEEKSYINFATHQSILGLILNTALRLDSIIIFQTIGATALSLYTIALVIPEQVRAFLKNASNLLFPKYVTYTPEVLRRSIVTRSVQLFLLLLLLALTYIALAPLVFHILFPKYAEAVLYTQILALAIPAGITLLVQSALKAEMDSRRLYYTQIGSAVIRTGLVATATLHFGIMGAIIAYVVAAYIEMLLAYLWFYRL